MIRRKVLGMWITAGLLAGAVPVSANPKCAFDRDRGLLAQEIDKGTCKSRPGFAHTISSRVYPLDVHFPDQVDMEYAKSILQYAETAWQVEIEQLKFLPPLGDHGLEGSDSLDIYIVTDLDPGIGGYTSFSGFEDSTSRSDAYGYVVINNNLNPRLVRGVVAHEFFHTSQMAYDWWEHLSLAEATAVWVTQYVFPDEDIFWRYFRFFNQEPEQGIDYIGLKNPFQYGSALFYQYLDERFGHHDGSVIREIWEKSVQDGFSNEPDFLDAVAAVVKDRSAMSMDLAGAWTEFGIWRLLIGEWSDGLHFHDGAHWVNSLPPMGGSHVVGEPTGEAALKNLMHYWSHAFISFQIGDSALPKTLHFNIDAPPLGEVRAMGLVHGSNGFPSPIGLTGGTPVGAEELSLDLPPHTTEALIILSLIPTTDYDPESGGNPAQPISYRWGIVP